MQQKEVQREREKKLAKPGHLRRTRDKFKMKKEGSEIVIIVPSGDLHLRVIQSQDEVGSRDERKLLL